MPLHTPGKSDSGNMGSTVAKQNPIKGGLKKQPNTKAKILATVTKNLKK